MTDVVKNDRFSWVQFFENVFFPKGAFKEIPKMGCAGGFVGGLGWSLGFRVEEIQ